MKLLLDEMWPPSAAEALRERGHDAQAVVERPDLRTRSDAAIFAAARVEDRAIVTRDIGDYRSLAVAEVEAGRPYPALILTSSRRWPQGARAVRRLVNALDALLASGAEIEGEHWLAPPD